MYLIFEGFMIW